MDRFAQEVVYEVISTMEDINSSPKRISEIVGVINGITFQTNILGTQRGGGGCAGRRTGSRVRSSGK